jgi:hypothetical protein
MVFITTMRSALNQSRSINLFIARSDTTSTSFIVDGFVMVGRNLKRWRCVSAGLHFRQV